MEHILVAIIAGLVILAFARVYLRRRNAREHKVGFKDSNRHKREIANVAGVIYAVGVAAAILVPEEALADPSHRYVILILTFVLAIAGALIYAGILRHRNRRNLTPHQPGSK